MPTITTRGAASARGFGLFTASLKGGWIGLLTDTGSGNRAYDITADSSGNVYTTGYADVNNRDIEIIKYNSSGVIQWQRSLGSTGSTYADGYGVNIDASGNVYACGFSNANGPSGDLRTAKYNSSGSIQWQRYAYDNPSFGSQAENVAVDSSGNVYVIGTTGLSVGEDSVFRLTLIKYNSSGTLQWVRRQQDASINSNYGYGVVLDSSGNPYVCGYRDTTSAFWIAKYNSSGALQWQSELITSGSEPYDIAIDSSSNLYVCGGSGDIVLAKYNSSGTLQWQRTLGGAGGDQGQSITVDSSDNVYVCGYSASGLSSYYFQIAKYNSSGTIQWQRRLGNSSINSYGYGIYADAGAIYVAGFTYVGGSNKTLIAKLPKDGSGTGTYTVGGYSFVYEASSLTGSTPTYTSQSANSTNETATLTNGTSTLTDAASSLTASVTAI
jgi:uncharacterized delta-60 repeat protein